MDAEPWSQLNRLLDEALDLPPAERERWLAASGPRTRRSSRVSRAARARAVGAGGDLLAPDRVRSLSASSSTMPTSRSILTRSRRNHRSVSSAARAGRGRHGHGVARRAHRRDGPAPGGVEASARRLAAADLVERMARERDILAALTHPHIARLYDAGVTPGGRPYLALEYVEGRPIDEYCASSGSTCARAFACSCRWPRRSRMRTRKLVVHRDLKPSNILVTADGQVRLLDFGIAKLLDEGSAGRPRSPSSAAVRTRRSTPRRSRSRASRSSIASDVYSLGVVLYELLTGARPYKLRRDSRGALEDAILQTDPDPPSAAAPTPSLREPARRSGHDRPQGAEEEAGRALRDGQRVRRRSPALPGRPAGPRAAGQRVVSVSKFVRRNKIAVGAAAALVVSLAAFGGVSAWQARVLAEQRRVAQVERDASDKWFACSSICSRPRIRRCGPTATACRSASSSRARRHGRSSACARPRPCERSCSRSSVSSTRRAASTPRRVRRSSRRSTSSAGWRGPDHPETLESLQALGELAASLDDDERARALLEESLERHRRVYGDGTSGPRECCSPSRRSWPTATSTRGRLLMRSLAIRRATLGRISGCRREPGVARCLPLPAPGVRCAPERPIIRRSRCSRRHRTGGIRSRSRSSTTLPSCSVS